MIFYTWPLDLRIFLRWLSPIEEDHFLAPIPPPLRSFGMAKRPWSQISLSFQRFMLHCLIDKMCLGTTALGNGSFDFGSEFPIFFLGVDPAFCCGRSPKIRSLRIQWLGRDRVEILAFNIFPIKWGQGATKNVPIIWSKIWVASRNAHSFLWKVAGLFGKSINGPRFTPIILVIVDFSWFPSLGSIYDH
jgi:hypothetical protein